MIYSKLYLEKKTNLLPLFIIAAGVLLGSMTTFFTKIPLSEKKITDSKIVRMGVVNVSDSSVGIFWESETQESGWVEYLKEKGGERQIVLDERDVFQKKNKFFFHFVTIKNLQPETSYTFELITDNGRYRKENNIYRFKTTKKEDRANRLKPAYGKVYNQNGKVADQTLVMIKIKGIYPLLTLSKQTGEWLIPFNRLIDQKTGLKTDSVYENSIAEIEFLSETRGRSYVKTTVANISPLSQGILLGKNYSFLTNNGEVLSAQDVNNLGREMLSFSVLYPKENALIPSSKPLFKGMGIPKKDVYVFVNSNPQFAFRTTVDDKGQWRIMPNNPIGSGTYLATFTTTDTKGNTITIKRQFMIAKNGEQVLGSATGEPTLIPTIPVIPTRIITSSQIQTTISPIPSVKPTMIYPTPSPTTEPPRTGGGSMGGFFGIAIGMLILGSGLLLVF